MKSRRNLPVLAIANPAPVSVAASPESGGGEDAESPGISMLQIFSILRAYRIPTLIIVSVISVIAFGLIKIMPKTYTATTTLMVAPEGGDPLGNNQGMATPMYNYMATESQLMMSAEVLLPVIDKLNLTQDRNYAGGYTGDGSNLRDWVRENLVKSLDIQMGAQASQLIYINVSARSAQLAAKIANTLAEVYLEQQRNRVTGPASERAKRYALELAELKDHVRVAQEQVTAYRQRTGVTDTTDRSNGVEQALLGMLEGKLQDAQNLRRAAEVKAAAEETASSAAGSVAVQGLRSQLAAQQTQLAQLRTTYDVQHPKVLELQNQITATQRNLAAELHNVSSVNTSDLTAARQMEAKMRAAVEEQRAKMLGSNKIQGEGTKIEMELESAQAVYKRALDGYDQIMFASGTHIANISVVSAAVPPQKPTKPNKPKLMVMGLFAGLFLGLVSPLLYEFLLNRRIRSRDDFERDFGLPVLMEFDRILMPKVTA